MHPKILRFLDYLLGWWLLAGVLLICLMGMIAALLRIDRLNDWCARQLED